MTYLVGKGGPELFGTNIPGFIYPPEPRPHEHGDAPEVDGHHLTVTNDDHGRLGGNCTCLHWYGIGYTCRACLAFDHSEHVTEALSPPDDAA